MRQSRGFGAWWSFGKKSGIFGRSCPLARCRETSGKGEVFNILQVHSPLYTGHRLWRSLLPVILQLPH